MFILLLQRIIAFFLGQKINQILELKVGGLLPHVDDERDFFYSVLGAAPSYQPKHTVWEIPTLTTKNQQSLNTCTWNALAGQAEVDEKIPLSVAAIVAYGRKTGRLSGNGYSSLRETQEVGREFGFAEEAVLPNVIRDWETYSDPVQLTPVVAANAAKHKSKSSFIVRTKEEVFKALDDGRVIQTGLDWYSKYNMGGGLTSPWILPWRKGTNVGGHAVELVGYNLTTQLLKFKNSFGPDWGYNSCFFVRFSDWFPQKLTGYVRVDMDDTTQQALLKTYEGSCIKSEKDPSIYLVKNGQKHHFLNEITFYAYGDHFDPNGTYKMIAQSLLDALPAGPDVKVEDSPYWPILSSHWAHLQTLRVFDAISAIQLIIKK